MPAIDLKVRIGPYAPSVEATLDQMDSEQFVPRLWSHDHTLWRDDPTEISNRLGWLRSAEDMRREMGRLQDFVRQVRSDGFSQVILLGMGGSSLAPELFGKVLAGPDGLDFAVLDSTDPAAVAAPLRRLDPRRTLVIVSTKSGGTVETVSLFKVFWNWLHAGVGQRDVGNHFVAITDPGSSLAALAKRHHFRATFINDPNLGGRYSALSFFGLVPAALVHVDVLQLLERAITAAESCGPRVAARDNPGARLGAILYVAAEAGRDKVTFVTAPELAPFGDWVEQLIAESTGKLGHGLTPVVGETVGPPEVYGGDRLFVQMSVGSEPADQAGQLRALEAAGHPVVRIRLRDHYDIGAQLFLWEMATAVVCSRWRINAFDQPDVESAKIVAREMIQQYLANGKLPSEPPAWQGEGISIYTGGEESVGASGASCQEATSLFIRAFLAQAEPGAYVAIQAYVQPSERADAVLLALRTAIRDRTRLAVTTGYGPRFLHSTGQLHKGDAGRGLFLQITADDTADVPIPDEAGQHQSAVSFGVLKRAQSLGDWGALRAVGRKTLRLHLAGDALGQLEVVAKALAAR